MKKKRLIFAEILLWLSIIVGICFLFINPYFILKGWFKGNYYSAGTVTNYITLGTNDFYCLQIIFDENGKVKSTSLDLSP